MQRSLLLAALLFACSAPAAEGSTPPVQAPQPAPELGRGAATLSAVLGPEHRLATPRALAFNPLRPDELWVLNAKDNSVVLLFGTGSDHEQFERRRDFAADHFLTKPSSIAFGADATSFGAVGTFGTCGESRNEGGIEGAKDFMGPVLWTSDLDIFAKKNPSGLGSHIDMLHASPLCMGIAHEHDNVYWATNGLTNSIIRYDFGVDHNVGQDNHSDGGSLEYARGQLKYVAGVPSNLVFHDGMLYIADTGNGRIAKLDTKSGTRGAKLVVPEPQRAGSFVMNGAVLTDVVPPGVLTAPSGLAIHNNIIYASDNATGRIVAFDLAGKQLNALDTGAGPGALAGITFGPDNKIYLVDMLKNAVLRIDP